MTSPGIYDEKKVESMDVSKDTSLPYDEKAHYATETIEDGDGHSKEHVHEVHAAAEAVAQQKGQTLKEAVCQWKPAIFYSLIFSSGGSYSTLVSVLTRG